MGISRTTLQCPGFAPSSSSMRVLDVDIGRGGDSVFALGDQAVEMLIFSDGSACKLPSALPGRKVRMFASGITLIGGALVSSSQDFNTWLVDTNGKILKALALDQGIVDLFRTENFLVATYGDEQVLMGSPQQQAGLAVFDLDGTFLWGWNDTIASERISDIIECYSAIPLGSDLVGLSAYTNFELALLDLRTRSAIVRPTPLALDGAMLSMRGATAFFYSHFGKSGSAFSWRLDVGHPKRVGELPRTPDSSVRGLPGGKFLEVAPTQANLVTVT